VLEQEQTVAAHQSGHNSGVVHSGVYYRPGSLRARCCVEGARALRGLCAEHGVPLVERTKLIVATRAVEVGRLEEIHRRGVANGVAGLHLAGPGEIREHEPAAAGLRALVVPRVGVVDFAAVTRALAAAVSAGGGEVRTGVRVLGVEPRGDGVRVSTDAGEVPAAAAVLCGGLWSDRLARSSGLDTGVRIVPFRGDYWLLRPGPSGVRAQAVDGRGRLVDDFVLVRRGPVVAVANAPSPAATASLAVARLVADAVEPE
jgi:L-2-hydroxyglutarate oxidase LhgO